MNLAEVGRNLEAVSACLHKFSFTASTVDLLERGALDRRAVKGPEELLMLHGRAGTDLLMAVFTLLESAGIEIAGLVSESDPLKGSGMGTHGPTRPAPRTNPRRRRPR